MVFHTNAYPNEENFVRFLPDGCQMSLFGKTVLRNYFEHFSPPSYSVENSTAITDNQNSQLAI